MSYYVSNHFIPIQRAAIFLFVRGCCSRVDASSLGETWRIAIRAAHSSCPPCCRSPVKRRERAEQFAEELPEAPPPKERDVNGVPLRFYNGAGGVREGRAVGARVQATSVGADGHSDARSDGSLLRLNVCEGGA